jgi:methyl-accepting chemotaxis protein
VTGLKHPNLVDSRQRLGRALFTIGVVGLVAAVVVGVAGWILATRANSRLTETIRPLSDLVVNVSQSVEATQVIVARTIEAVEGIESATRSAGRTLGSVSGLIDTTADVIGGDLADSLESAVGTLPALVDTGRIIDRTMRTLSLVGVDYDPDAPLDESLASLEESLRPIPEQLRGQVDALEDVRTDIDVVVQDSGALAATLLEARIEMAAAEEILADTGENVTVAAESLASIEGDLDAYDILSKVAVAAVAAALLSAAVAPLLLGLHFQRSQSNSADAPGSDVTDA